jgi:hypothetical protein
VRGRRRLRDRVELGSVVADLREKIAWQVYDFADADDRRRVFVQLIGELATEAAPALGVDWPQLVESIENVDREEFARSVLIDLEQLP